jgi:chloramphenicol 3-O phosphotransferase
MKNVAATTHVDPVRYGPVILLNGTSSAGKTSLAKALQPMLRGKYQHLQLDSFRAMEPSGYWDASESEDAEVQKMQLAALCRAMNAAVAEYSKHGQGVIFDTELSHRDAMRYVLQDLIELPIFMVGVFCSLEETERREVARGDRPIGLARRQYARAHAGKEYDFRIDTTTSSVADCAEELTEWLAGRPSPRALLLMSAMTRSTEQGAAASVA